MKRTIKKNTIPIRLKGMFIVDWATAVAAVSFLTEKVTLSTVESPAPLTAITDNVWVPRDRELGYETVVCEKLTLYRETVVQNDLIMVYTASSPAPSP